MKTEPEKKVSLLAPLADAYGPTQAQAERVLAKLDAYVAQAPDVPSPAEASPARAGRAAAAREAKNVLLVGLSCMALAITGALMLREPEAAPGVAPPTTPTAPTTPTILPSTAPRAIEAPLEGEGTSAVSSISVHALPTVADVHPAEKDVKKLPSSAPPSGSERAASSSDTLEREARLLAEARRALKNGDGAGALALLDEHARVFPRGWLANERAAERVVVLCSLGHRADAVREATAFLERRPKGALARRVEMSCAGQGVKDARQ